MPRPSPEQRKRLEANRRAKAKLRDEIAAREQRTHDRVQGIVDTALGRSRTPSGAAGPRRIGHATGRGARWRYLRSRLKRMRPSMPR